MASAYPLSWLLERLDRGYVGLAELVTGKPVPPKATKVRPFVQQEVKAKTLYPDKIPNPQMPGATITLPVYSDEVNRPEGRATVATSLNVNESDVLSLMTVEPNGSTFTPEIVPEAN